MGQRGLCPSGADRTYMPAEQKLLSICTSRTAPAVPQKLHDTFDRLPRMKQYANINFAILQRVFLWTVQVKQSSGECCNTTKCHQARKQHPKSGQAGIRTERNFS